MPSKGKLTPESAAPEKLAAKRNGVQQASFYRCIFHFRLRGDAALFADRECRRLRVIGSTSGRCTDCTSLHVHSLDPRLAGAVQGKLKGIAVIVTVAKMRGIRYNDFNY